MGAGSDPALLPLLLLLGGFGRGPEVGKAVIMLWG